MHAKAQFARSHTDRILAIVEGQAGNRLPAVHKPSSLVAESWRRCVGEYHLDPTGLQRPDVATAQETGRRAEALNGLLPTALAAIPELSRALRDCPHILLLADAGGVVLHRLGALGLAEFADRAEVSPGAIWDERRQGTNGLGTSLACGRTAAIHFADHFAPGNAWLSCVSTPLRNPGGHVVGALNVTFLQKSRMLYGSIVEYLIESTGRRIEDQFMLSEHARHWIVSLSLQSEMTGLDVAAALAVDQREHIVGANNAARLLFATTRTAPVGLSLRQVFGRSLDELLVGRNAERSVVVDFGGQHLQVNVRPPLRRPGATRSSSGNEPPREVRLSVADVVGLDAGLRDSVLRLRRFLDRKMPILIGGETGTGKDVLARALHEESSRRSKPFVAINCAALPDTLIESELFGYADGAFTGANRRGYQGKIIQSSGGTLFLDEIGDMPLHMQTRLLRVLTQEEVCPLGSDRVVPVDLNIISASHRDLEQLVESGSFRADLLYRLRGAKITLPTVRDRSDKADLLRSIWNAECLALNIHPTLGDAALERLLSYAWPGNVRELRNALRAVIITDFDGVITPDDLPDFVVSRAAVARPGESASLCSEGSELLDVLRSSSWHVASAARSLGMSRQAVYRAMARHNIRSPNFVDSKKSDQTLAAKMAV